MPATLADPEVGAIRVRDRTNRGRLPGSVGSEEPEHLAGCDCERHVLERQTLAETFGEVIDDES